MGINGMLIGCKYEEIWAPRVNDLIIDSDNTYIREHILKMKKEIFGVLGWHLTTSTPYVFLVRYTKALIPYDNKVYI